MNEHKHCDVALLLAISFVIVTVRIDRGVNAQQSPCPNIFTYESLREENRWYGNVVLQSDEELFSIWIDVILDRRAELLGNWFGDVTTSDNKLFTITNRNEHFIPNNRKSIRFFVKYDSATSAPILESIRLNGRAICTKRKTASQPQRASVSTKRTTTTTEKNNYFNTNDNHGNENGIRASAVHKYENSMPSVSSDFTTTTQRPVWISSALTDIGFNNYGFVSELNPTRNRSAITNNRLHGSNNFETNRDRFQCGVVAAQARPLITHGEETTAGQWPWHVALYRSEGIHLKYVCGGSLVSRRHVVTAAHCVTLGSFSRIINPSSFMLYVGKFNLTKWADPGLQNFQVENILVHPEFNNTSFDCDVAVLKLVKDVEITDHVRPVCLWQGDTDLSSIVKKEGTVVGWGYDENGHVTEHLMQAQMPIVSQQTCIDSKPEFFYRFTSSRTYCAGFTNGTSVCSGDSGGGMVFSRPNTNPQVWQLRGITSISVALQKVCDSHHYAVFADAAKHKNWIESVINT